MCVALGIATYKYKHRGNMSTSVFLMQTRVAAQGTVVSCLSLGLAYQMFNKWVLHGGEDE
jgi:Hypoxia induced protein conserved region